MKAPNKQIVDNLQAAAQMLSHIVGQFKVDAHELHAMGLDWLSKKFKSWKKEDGCQLSKVIDRILYFDADPDYEIGAVAGSDTIMQTLERAAELVAAALEAFCDFRTQAWDARADYTPDVYEHAIHCLEKQAYQIEREQELVEKLGEPGYIGSRLEDQ